MEIKYHISEKDRNTFKQVPSPKRKTLYALRFEFACFLYDKFMNWFVKHVGGAVHTEMVTKSGRNVDLFIDWIGSKDNINFD